MIRYLASRVVVAILVTLTVLVALASFARVLPGDAATIMLGQRATPQLVALVREEMDLDKPVPVQVGGFVVQCRARRSGSGLLHSPSGHRHRDGGAAAHHRACHRLDAAGDSARDSARCAGRDSTRFVARSNPRHGVDRGDLHTVSRGRVGCCSSSSGCSSSSSRSSEPARSPTQSTTCIIWRLAGRGVGDGLDRVPRAPAPRPVSSRSSAPPTSVPRPPMGFAVA